MHTPTFIVLCALALPARALAQGTGVIEIPRLTGPITFDGRIEEQSWTAVAPVPLTLLFPSYQGTPTERTEIRVGHDGEHLWVAGSMFDTDPSGIRVNSLLRDYYAGDDMIGVFIDALNNNETGLWFVATPAGNRIDLSMADDSESQSDSWNGFWDVATHTDERGWFIEMRFPLATLGPRVAGDSTIMGISVTRFHPRKSERVIFPDIHPRWSYRRPSVMQDIVLRGVSVSRPAYVTPYVLGGSRRTVEPQAPFGSVTDQPLEAGVDVRYGIGSSFTLDASVNTDFAEVEADDQRTNFTRFPLFFPEKRQFFQERAGLFEFDGRLFHSRRIGLDDQGRPVRILGGMRLVGSASGWDIGLLDMQTANSTTLPSENFGVLRVRRSLWRAGSFAGGMVTSRRGTDGSYNVGLGVDGLVRPFGNELIEFEAATTVDSDTSAALLEAGTLRLGWRRPTAQGLGYYFNVNRVGGAYRPEVGFIDRDNFTAAELGITWATLPGAGSPLRSAGGEFYTGIERINGGEVRWAEVTPGFNWEFKSGHVGMFQPIWTYEYIDAPFTIGEGVTINPGDYRYTTLRLTHDITSRSQLRADGVMQTGPFYDGWRHRLELNPEWSLSRHFEVSGTWAVNRFTFDERGQGFTSHLVRLRTRVSANPRLTATTLAQYNSVADVIGLNLRIRYNVSEGRDIWLVYDENVDTAALSSDDPFLGPASRYRSLRLKVSWTAVL